MLGSTRNAIALFATLVGVASALSIRTGSTAAAPRESFRRPLVVIGAGVAGLSVALEAANRGIQVAVLSRDVGEAASLTAAGMLAPQAERLESGPYLDLCLRARAIYPNFVAQVEGLSGLDVGFAARGGFFAPALRGDVNHRWTPPQEAGPAEWMDAQRARTLEPLLGEDVIGGWWYPNDLQVEPQKLHQALWKACEHVGVHMVKVAAEELLPIAESKRVDQIRLADGRFIGCDDVVVASGSWMRELLPLPIFPIKGQMMSLRPTGRGLAAKRLDRVLFGDSCYVVPKGDGRIIVGATSEPEAGFDCRVTPKGIATLCEKLGKLVPSLLEYTIEDTWAGLRPSAPDFLPILGKSDEGKFYENVYCAGGYWRNGMLLPPVTSKLVVDQILGALNDEDEDLLKSFSLDRFFHGEKEKSPASLAYPAKSMPEAPALPDRQPSPAERSQPESTSSPPPHVQHLYDTIQERKDRRQGAKESMSSPRVQTRLQSVKRNGASSPSTQLVEDLSDPYGDILGKRKDASPSDESTTGAELEDEIDETDPYGDILRQRHDAQRFSNSRAANRDLGTLTGAYGDKFRKEGKRVRTCALSEAAALGSDPTELAEIMSLIEVAPTAGANVAPQEKLDQVDEALFASLSALAEPLTSGDESSPSAAFEDLTLGEEESFRAAALAGESAADDFQALIDLAPAIGDPSKIREGSIDIQGSGNPSIEKELLEQGSEADEEAQDEDVPVSEKQLFYIDDNGNRVLVPFQRPPPGLGFPVADDDPVQQYNTA